MINDVLSMMINKIRSYLPVQSCLLDSFTLFLDMKWKLCYSGIL